MKALLLASDERFTFESSNSYTRETILELLYILLGKRDLCVKFFIENYISLQLVGCFQRKHFTEKQQPNLSITLKV